MKIILASNSPRRKEILQKFGYHFEIVKSDYQEVVPENLNNDSAINSLIEKNCYCKAQAVAAKIAPQAIVIGADTVVTLDSVCLLKPCNFCEAFLFLRRLSGRIHTVKTAVCLVYGEKSLTRIFETKVSFRVLKDDEINAYIEGKSPLDKAGAYGIQDFLTEEEATEIKPLPPGSFINKIEGSYYNVMGICPYGLKEMLEEFGVQA